MYGMSVSGSQPYGWQGYGSYGLYGSSNEDASAQKPEGVYGSEPYAADKAEDEEFDSSKRLGKKSSPANCETCKNRKYKDGSDEMVSFKAAAHINPNAAASVVMSHEREHVSNAYQKADAGNGEVVRASVQLKMDVCPECGRTYVSGGLTTTQIRYYNESNPYQKDMKESDADNKYRGANVDIAA